MTHSPAHVLARWLIGAALLADPTGVSPTWPVTVGNEPDDGTTTNVATAYDTSGQSLARALDASLGVYVFRYGVQLRFRSSDRPTGWTKAEAVASALAVVRGRSTTDQVTISGTTYTLLNVQQQAPPLFLGHDGPKRRSLHTVNFLLSLKQEA